MSMYQIQTSDGMSNYISIVDAARLFGFHKKEVKNKFNELMKHLFKNKVQYHDANGVVKPLVSMVTTKGRFTDVYVVPSDELGLNVLARFVKENGFELLNIADSLSLSKLERKIGIPVRYIKEKMQELYQNQEMFEDDKGVLQDLVMLDSQGKYCLSSHPNALNKLKNKLRASYLKAGMRYRMTPARVAVRMGYQKGFGSTLGLHMKKVYNADIRYINEQGVSKPLVQRIYIDNIEHFCLAEGDKAFHFYQMLYKEKMMRSMPVALKEWMQDERPIYDEELYSFYKLGETIRLSSGEVVPMVSRHVKKQGVEYRLFPHPQSYEKMVKRMNARKVSGSYLTVSDILNSMRRNCERENIVDMLEVLHKKNIHFMNSNGRVMPLVLQKNNRYMLVNDVKAKNIFQQHFYAYVDSFAELPANYRRSVSDVTVDKKLTRKVLLSFYKERVFVKDDNGNMVPLVQFYRLPRKCVVRPCLNKSILAKKLFKERMDRIKE